MKKILGIVVVSLLLSGNAYALSVKVEAKSSDYVVYSGKTRLLSDKKMHKDQEMMGPNAQQHCQTFNKDAYLFFGYADGSGAYKKGVYIIDKDDTSYFTKFMLRFFCGDSISHALTLFNKNDSRFFNSELRYPEFVSYSFNSPAQLWNAHNISSKDRESLKNNEIKKGKIEIASIIDKAKDTCKSLGFKEGTEKFADCSLKLYSQSVELAAEQNKTVVMQPQSSGSNVMTIYDPVRDNNALIKRGQRMLSGACTLGIDC